ncbi:beta-galactosidase [Mariniphaga sp.]|uniref:beta-galactosidase n=1 Tax=Mariniphaga sp. TaxID=1954475 RepID=UPI0035669FCE
MKTFEKNCKKNVLIIGLIFFFVSNYAQNNEQFFTGKGNMPVGTYYYPEHWPHEQWDRDLNQMADLGFEFTHFAEFAWARLEPEEGKFDFEWLDWCLAEAAKNGLKVIMCTPSPCPPAWLTEKYPEVLNVNENGIRSAPNGNRLHANQRHPEYRKYIERIVTKMAERYGNDERIWGWQIDNEPHIGTIYDYSAFAQDDFKSWLKEKYNYDISLLNQAWGAAFWSSTFNHFGQIRIPNAVESSTNPHAILDFKRYTADALAESVRFQAQLLRKLISSNQWITTNFAYYKFLPPVDPFRNRGDLDFASHTMYLLSTFLNYPEGDLNFRLGSGLELSFSNELARSVEGVTGIMELQPGQINWGQYNAQPLPGAVRMWIWHSFGLGDKFVCTYRFRQPLFGSEQTHKGIMETNGTTVARGGKEYVQAIAEIKELQEKYKASITVPASLLSRKTAFLWKMDNLWEMEASPHSQAWDTWQHWYTYYSALKTMGAPVHFFQENDNFDPTEYPFMVAPAHSMVDAGLVKKWQRYVEKGGNLILSCRAGQKDNNGHFHETLLQQPIWDLIGAKIEDNDQLPSRIKGKVKTNKTEHSWNVWGEWLSPYHETETLATYADQFYAETPAVISRKLGKGTVTYVGAWSENGTLEKEILRNIYQNAGAEILNLPEYVFVEWRDGYWVGVNYTSETSSLPIPENTQLIFGEREIQPGGVSVWME